MNEDHPNPRISTLLISGLAMIVVSVIKFGVTMPFALEMVFGLAWYFLAALTTVRGIRAVLAPRVGWIRRAACILFTTAALCLNFRPGILHLGFFLLVNAGILSSELDRCSRESEERGDLSGGGLQGGEVLWVRTEGRVWALFTVSGDSRYGFYGFARVLGETETPDNALRRWGSKTISFRRVVGSWYYADLGPKPIT
jgi:hypothetical protein